MTDHHPHQFDRVPATEAEQPANGRATRTAILDWWAERFGVPRSVFAEYSFWEKGAGKIWIFHGDLAGSVEIEALGLRFMHTRQEHWKPTTNAVQRFGSYAERNVIHLDPARAARFVRGEDQSVEWDGDWGYLIVTRDIAGSAVPVGVGLYTYGELQSMIAKGRRRDLAEGPDTTVESGRTQS